MRAVITPGGIVSGATRVPGDKSIAHRWVILAATGSGRSELRSLPPSLDLGSTARVVASLFPRGTEALGEWGARVEVDGSLEMGHSVEAEPLVEVQGSGRSAMIEARVPLDCGNSGTTMRLVAGLAAAAPFRSVLTGDASLRRRPMERVAKPLRAMGARVETSDGRAPLTVEGAALQGVRWRPEVPSAQVKGAVLLAGLAAEGTTAVIESVPTRDHTERALDALGAPVSRADGSVAVARFQHVGFVGEVPGDVSSAAFLLGAGFVSDGPIVAEGVGVNPTRCHFLDVMRRMGLETRTQVEGDALGEPVGTVEALPAGAIRGTVVPPDELPLVIDEVPLLAMLAAHGEGETRFEGAGELRRKESDRLGAVTAGIRGLGGEASADGDTLVVGGGGLAGGRADARGDHRVAMALVVGALAARGPCEVDGIEWATVSFPGFVGALGGLGARLEVER